MKFCNTLLFLSSLSFVLGNVAQAASSTAMTRQAFIGQAKLRGEYSSQKALYYKILSIYHPEKLPPELQKLPNATQLSATALFQEIFLAKLHNDFYAGEGTAEVIERPVSLGYVDSDKYPIRVHYTNYRWKGLVDDALRAAEESWAVEVGELGFWPPPPDFGMGGSDHIDIYIHDNAAGAAGYTAPEDFYFEKGTSACTSYIVVDAETAYSDYMNVTIAHELNHSMQMAYDCTESGTFFENTSTFIEDFVFVNDDRTERLPYFQALPHNSLNTHYSDGDFQLYQYGGFLVPLFVDEYFGNGDGKLVPKIWEKLVQEDYNNSKSYFQAIDEIASQKNLTFDDFQVLFTEWRYFLGEYDDHQHFKDSDKWTSDSYGYTYDPAVALDQIVQIKQTYYYEIIENQEIISPNSSSYIMIKMPKYKSTGKLKLKFHPAQSKKILAGNRWYTQLFCKNTDLSNKIYPLPLNNDYTGSIELSYDNDISYCTLAITNLGLPNAQLIDLTTLGVTTERQYSYTVEVQYVAADMDDPEITGVSANILECSGKQSLTLKGANFYDNMKITVGDEVVSDLTDVGDSFVKFVTPAMKESGFYEIKVYNINDEPVSSATVAYYGDSCTCGCDNSLACDATCACDPDCIICKCDLDTGCSADCACDVDCTADDDEKQNSSGCSCDSRRNPEQNLNNFICFLAIGLIGGLGHFRKKSR